MGTKMASAYANIFMGNIFQEKYTDKILRWKRFIDDIFLIWTGDTQQLLTHINSIHPTIEFTSDISLVEITFLDVIYKGINFHTGHQNTLNQPTNNSMSTLSHTTPQAQKKRSDTYERTHVKTHSKKWLQNYTQNLDKGDTRHKTWNQKSKLSTLTIDPKHYKGKKNVSTRKQYLLPNTMTNSPQSKTSLKNTRNVSHKTLC